MNIDPVENCNHLECIRCGRCKNACPVDAISYGVPHVLTVHSVYIVGLHDNIGT